MKKYGRRCLALVLMIAMLSNTLLGCAAPVQNSSGQMSSVGNEQQENRSPEGLSKRADAWTEPFETVWDQKDADALRTVDSSVNILVAAETCVMSGLTFGEMVSVGSGQLKLTESHGQMLSVEGTRETLLYGVELEQLTLHADKGQSVSLRLDEATKIPEIVLEGEGGFSVEGTGALGLVRVTDNPESLLIGANCSVVNESGADVTMETADGNTEQLQPGAQKETELYAYLITFMADGQVYRAELAEPGTTIPFPEQIPVKEGYVFTTWYTDEAMTEPCSRYAAVEGQTTLYGRFVAESEAVHITFNAMGGRELAPLTVGKGESLLTRPVQEVYTEKEGYTFGGWCTDEECTEALSYSQPLEKDMTLYANFVSNEAQEITKDSGIANIEDLDWQGGIALRTLQPMTAEEVQKNIELIAGTGSTEPAVTVEKKDDGFVLYGTGYEKDGKQGFEPGSTFTVRLSEQVRFADYSDDTDTAVVSVYKEQVENVVFSDELNYVLWDDVLKYEPVTEVEEDSQQTAPEADAAQDGENAQEEETPTQGDENAQKEENLAQDAENAQDEEILDQEGENAQEIEQAAYMPGSAVIRGGEKYKEGDLIAFYDGEIGRDEKNITAYTEGDLNGYVLFAEVIETRETQEGTFVSFSYASPEDYLAEFEVHTSEEVELENEFSEEDLSVLTSQLTRQVEENEELKAQMLVSVMSAPETQRQLDELYGEGVYSLAGMTATLKPGKPVVTLSVSGSEVSAQISISATATIRNNGRIMLTVEPTLAFTQSLSVKTNVDGGAVWIDMSVAVRSTSKIELTMSATSGGDVTVFSEAKDTLTEIVKPEGIAEDEYETYDAAVSELMDTMNGIVATSLQYNDLFDVLLLRLSMSFYGIITFSFEVHFVGQIGVLATFGVEIVATSGVKIGFKYDFLKFKGSSYTERLESSVTNTVYLIGKVGARVGLRLRLSVTLCGIASASITGSVYAYAELSGLFFNTTNLITGANTNLGALKFEVGLDVVVSLGLKVSLVIKTVRKNWTVYSGRWPLWSTSISSKMTYMDADKLEQQWEDISFNANSKVAFGFVTVPMKTWDLLKGDCMEQEQMFAQSGKFHLEIENLIVNGEAVGEGDPRNAVFTVGDPEKNQHPGSVYMDTMVAGMYGCAEVELDVVLVYEDKASSALVKKQKQRFHLERDCAISTTTQNTKVVLYDRCARNWGIETAEWDNAAIYEMSFSNSHMIGGVATPNATGTLDQEEILKQAKIKYPELAEMQYAWAQSGEDGKMPDVQYASPRISNFCYMTTANGVVRFDVYPESKEYEVTYYLYVDRFEGTDGMISYHVKLDTDEAYTLSLITGSDNEEHVFTLGDDGVYHLTIPRTALDGSEHPIWITAPDGEKAASGLTVTGREYAENVYFDLHVGNRKLDVTVGEGVRSWTLTKPAETKEDGIAFGSQVELQAELEEGYGALTVECQDKTIAFKVDNTTNTVRFTMPAADVSLTLRAYREHSVTYRYNYDNLGAYKTEIITEDMKFTAPNPPTVAGMTFRGWYTTAKCTGEPYAFGGKLEEDLTLYADWTCNVNVIFGQVKGQAQYVGEDGAVYPVLEDDGKEYYSFTYSTLRVGEKLLDIVTPEYEGYQFMDWYLDAARKTQKLDLESYTLTGGVTIYAKWARELTLTYDRNDPVPNDDGQSTVIMQTIGYDGYIVPLVPEDPEYMHYRFTGWYRNPAATVPFDVSSEVLTGDTTLYAGWEPVSYTITYDLAGGRNAARNPASYTTEDSFTLAVPSRTGYDFVGWTGTGLEDLTEKVTVEVGDGGDRTYTAHWKVIDYTITYDKTYGSAINNPTTYTIESEDIVLEEPVREKYEFLGWVGTGLTEAAKSVVIPNGSIGNRSYRATWETTDSTERILQSIELLLEANPYETDLVSFLTAKDLTAEKETVNAKLDPAVEAAVEEHLKSMVENDRNGTYPLNENRTEVSAYAAAIELDAELVGTNRAGDTARQVYTYKVNIRFTDEAGQVHERTVDAYSVYLKKLVPQVTMPEMKPLTYGQKVSDSQVDKAGEANYANKELSVNVNVSGRFVWNDEDSSKVPYGLDNGTKNARYQMSFVPSDTELYAVVENSVALITQIGVMVEASAEDRFYEPGNTSATGTAKLYYVNADGTNGEEVTVDGLLKEGTFNFVKQQGTQYVPDAAPVQDKTVLYDGYGLNTAANTDEIYGVNAYYLVNPGGITMLATIKKVGASEMTVTNQTTQTYEYGQTLSDVTFSGRMMFGEREIEGTWRWENSSETLSIIPVSTHNIIFTPVDTVGYDIVTKPVDINVTKKTVTKPAAPTNLVYNGNTQTSGLQPVTGVYTVYDAGGTDVGSYEATLTLSNTDLYRWADTEEASVKVTYNIAKATATVNGTATCSTGMAYGQKLMLAGASGTNAYLATNISGDLTVTFGGSTVQGRWEWDLENLSDSQPLSASNTAYDVPITFIPKDTNLAKNIQTPGQTVKVKVNKVNPDTSGCGITAVMYQTQKNDYPLSTAAVTMKQNLPVNPNDNTMKVAGIWDWESDASTVKPMNSAEYYYKFTPSDSTNYDPLSVKVSLEVKKPSTVNYTVMAVSSLPYNGTLKPLFENGITSNVLSGTTSGTMAVPVDLYAANNSQTLSFQLSDSNYYVSGLRVTAAKGFTSGVTNAAVGERSELIEVESEDTSRYNRDYVSYSGATYTIHLNKQVVAWEDVTVEVVVQSRTSTLALSAASQNTTYSLRSAPANALSEAAVSTGSATVSETKTSTTPDVTAEPTKESASEATTGSASAAGSAPEATEKAESTIEPAPEATAEPASTEEATPKAKSTEEPASAKEAAPKPAAEPTPGPAAVPESTAEAALKEDGEA